MSDMLRQRSALDDYKTATNLFTNLAGVFAVTIEVFMHRYMGHRYLGGKGLAALIVIPMFGAFCFPHHSQTGLLLFLGLYVIAALKVQGESKRLRAKGVVVHSRYNGWPKKLKIGASAEQEQRMKSFNEPLVAATLGALTYWAFDQPLGAYLMVSAFALGITNTMYRVKTGRQEDDLIDARIDQELLAERVREHLGGR